MFNTPRVFGFAALAAVMVFMMTACGDGGRWVATKVHSYNNKGAPPALSWAAAPRGSAALDVTPRAAHASFDTYAAFYGKLGNLVEGGSITPTEFNITATITAMDTDGNTMPLGSANFNFANDVTLTVDTIPAGVTCAALWFNFSPATLSGDIIQSSVEFEWPGGRTAFDAHTRKENYAVGTQGFTSSWDGDNITLWFNNLLPYVAGSIFNISPNLEILLDIFYGGEESKIMHGFFPLGELITATPYPAYEIGSPHFDNLIVPFTPVSVPNDAASITLHLSWNLDGIISRYDNSTPGDAADDIFILKDGWWDGLRLYADIQ